MKVSFSRRLSSAALVTLNENLMMKNWASVISMVLINVSMDRRKHVAFRSLLRVPNNSFFQYQEISKIQMKMIVLKWGHGKNLQQAGAQRHLEVDLFGTHAVSATTASRGDFKLIAPCIFSHEKGLKRLTQKI